jgi:hypothetical protein
MNKNDYWIITILCFIFFIFGVLLDYHHAKPYLDCVWAMQNGYNLVWNKEYNENGGYMVKVDINGIEKLLTVQDFDKLEGK